MGKQYVNEFKRTSFVNSGRIAGMGIQEDRYDEESYPGSRKQKAAYGRGGWWNPKPEDLNSEVIIIKGETKNE